MRHNFEILAGLKPAGNVIFASRARQLVQIGAFTLFSWMLPSQWLRSLVEGSIEVILAKRVCLLLNPLAIRYSDF